VISVDINAPDTRLIEDVIFTDLVTGLPVDVTGDIVKVALVANGEYPTAEDWVTCAWSAAPNAVTVQFNQGGAGSFDLTALVAANDGATTYYPWVQVFDSPDEPIIVSLVPILVRTAQ